MERPGTWLELVGVLAAFAAFLAVLALVGMIFDLPTLL